MQKTSGFVKPPLSYDEKKRLAKKFIESASFKAADNPAEENTSTEHFKKSKIVKLNLRVPESFRHDIKQIEEHTGLTMNAICTQILWVGLKKTIKEITEGVG